MREEFLIERKETDVYNYISGRVKVLETMLFTRETFEHFSTLSMEELRRELIDTSYKEFIKSNELLDQAIFQRFYSDIIDMEKYVSKGFINAFFKNKEIFLKIKKWVLSPNAIETIPLYMELRRFAEEGSGDFPIEFHESYMKMLLFKENPLKVAMALDIYRLKYLVNNATLTGSDLIRQYYSTYTEFELQNIFYRLKGFMDSRLVKEKDLLEILSTVFEVLPSSEFSRKAVGIKNMEQFREFVLESGERSDLVLKRSLIKILEKGKFINIGLEVIFVYLKRLEFEVETLSMLISGKKMQMSKDEILERVSVSYA
ncbi:MAG: V-type ATPase subunit [Caldisericaceae bacterium]|nr:V-type ATPase subunit [Caldisericaceae bacterium]RLD19607.1 MAG: hypothetical protein DRI33_02780 [Caldisericota bacterium]